MKVLHVISNLSRTYGGPMTALLGLAAAQRERGDEVTVVATVRPGEGADLGAALEAVGCRVLTPGPARSPFAYHPSTAAVLREAVQGAGVVHAHGLWEHVVLAAAAAAEAAKIPFVLRTCGLLSTYSIAHKSWRKRLLLGLYAENLLKNRALVHCTSSSEAAEVAGVVSGARIEVVPNGTEDPGRAGPLTAAEAHRLFPALPSAPFAVFMGRLHAVKNVHLLVEALPLCRNLELELVIVGPDEEGRRAALEALAARTGVAGRMHFLGPVWGDARFQILAAAALLLLPSTQENFGIALVEALACGTPVLVSDRIALAGDIVAAGAGEAVPIAAGPFARAMDAWMADPARRAAAGAAGRELVRERYSWQAVAARLAAVYGAEAAWRSR